MNSCIFFWSNLFQSLIDGGLSPLPNPKSATEIRIRRISGTPTSPHPRIRTLSASSQGTPRVRTLSGSSTASTGKTPGQFLALSNIPQAQSESPHGTNDMQPGSLVFVQSNPTVNEKGEVTPGLVHIYMVSSPPSTNLLPLSKEPIVDVASASDVLSFNEVPITPAEETDQREKKVFHSPSILAKSPKRRSDCPPQTTNVLDEKSTLSTPDTHSNSDSIIPTVELHIGNENFEPVEVLDIETINTHQDIPSCDGLSVENQVSIGQMENPDADHAETVSQSEQVVYIELT